MFLYQVGRTACHRLTVQLPRENISPPTIEISTHIQHPNRLKRYVRSVIETISRLSDYCTYDSILTLFGTFLALPCIPARTAGCGHDMTWWHSSTLSPPSSQTLPPSRKSLRCHFPTSQAPTPPQKKKHKGTIPILAPLAPLAPLLNFSSSHLFKLPSFNKCSRNCRMLPLNTSAGSEEAKLFEAKITWHPKVEFMEDVVK